MRRRPLLAALAAFATIAVFPVLPASAGPTGFADVMIRDNMSDIGTVPSPAPHWVSPDIVVCPGPPGCTEHSPAAGSTTNVHVTVHNRGDVATTGSVDLWYAEWGPSAASGWRIHWNHLATQFNVAVPASGAKTVTFAWSGVPGPGHFCLVAIWDSPDDPVGPDLPNIDDYVKYNNNVAWHNINTILLLRFQIFTQPLTLSDPGPDPWRSSLVITPVGRPFVGPGRLVVDLGNELAARWRAAGQPGVGVQPAGPTQVEVVGAGQARIDGLLINPQEVFTTTMSFTANNTAPGDAFVLNAVQTNSQGVDQGGVQYRLVIQ
jgi:hypothetical protein